MNRCEATQRCFQDERKHGYQFVCRLVCVNAATVDSIPKGVAFEKLFSLINSQPSQLNRITFKIIMINLWEMTVQKWENICCCNATYKQHQQQQRHHLHRQNDIENVTANRQFTHLICCITNSLLLLFFRIFL